MEPNGPKKKAGEDISVEKKPAGHNNEEETDDLHDRERPATDNVSVRDAPAASPVRFYARLRRDLEVRGIDFDKLPRLTAEGKHPPCFETMSQYEAWLASASLLGAIVPYRYDMPAEPAYCHDCTPAFQKKAKALGTCQFPNTRFERRQTVVQDDGGKGIEIELVGVSRSETTVLHLEDEYG